MDLGHGYFQGGIGPAGAKSSPIRAWGVGWSKKLYSSCHFKGKCEEPDKEEVKPEWV